MDFFPAPIIRCTRFVRPERANDSTFGGFALAAWHVASHAMLPRHRTFGFSLVEFLLTPGILSVLSRADFVLSPEAVVRVRADADTRDAVGLCESLAGDARRWRPFRSRSGFIG